MNGLNIRHWQNAVMVPKSDAFDLGIGYNSLDVCYEILVIHVIVGSFSGNMRIIYEDCSNKAMPPMINL